MYNSDCVSENNKTLCDILKLVPKPYIVVGDFNYSEDINWDTNTATSKSKEFLNAVNDLFLTQHVNFPTHSSVTMPNLVFSTESNLILNWKCYLRNIVFQDI